jgi:oligogalacturonide lyase
MRNFTTYRDSVTGYEIRQYTQGQERNTKLYFTTENFTTDDRYFFFNQQIPSGLKNEVYQGTGDLYKAEVESGELKLVAGSEYSGFAMDRFENYGVMTKGNVVCRYECDSDKIIELGALPPGGHITGHLTTSKSGKIVCSYKQKNCIYALVTLDPQTGKSEVVYQSDYNLGHAQVCPTDENTIFFIHETGGDALQRMWLFDVTTSTARPYYVESEGDWITHEVWTADGENIVFMKLPSYLMMGTKDGQNFRIVTKEDQLLHPGISRDSKWFCADRIGYLGVESPNLVYLVNGETGNSLVLANTDTPRSGADHLHPSFNRKGDMILFNRPFENGSTQVCLIDLNQVERP